MTEFPDGYLLMREYSTLTEAHVEASRIASKALAGSDFRLIEVSPTAGGAWLLAFDTTDTIGKSDLDVVQSDAAVMNAFLSLGPKADQATQFIGIIESTSIAKVFQSSRHYSQQGLSLLEIRVKRAGPAGAYAFFAIAGTSPSNLGGSGSTVLPMTVVPLNGDYRRFF